MAKKTKKAEQPAKSLNEALGLAKIFNERTDFIIGIILLIASAFVILSMSSFIVTGPSDQSILEDLRPDDWHNIQYQFANICGSGGAILAWFLMSCNFGLSAFCIPLFFVFVGLRLMKAINTNLWKVFFYLVVIMEWTCVSLAAYSAPLLGFLSFNPGGNHGVFVTDFFERVIGLPGLTMLLILVAIIFLCVVSMKTVFWIRHLMNPTGWMSKVRQTVQVGKGNDTEDNYDKTETDNYQKNEQLTINEESGPIVIDDDDFLDTNPANVALTVEEHTSDGTQLTVEKAAEEEKAKGRSVAPVVTDNSPINPKEPFLKYKYPTLDLLKKYDGSTNPEVDMEEVNANNRRIIEVLNSFGVKIREIKATVGPTITLYEVTPAEGVKISKIRNLEDDIALCLSALGVRIIAPIPGKGTVGIEVPNKKPQIVSMESLINSRKFQETTMDLPLAIGKTITNEVFMVDLAKLPHLLVAGATGQGKSVGLNAIITSLLYKKHPNELKIVLVDPKKVEFSPYAPIADHFMASTDENVDEPIITDVTKVVRTLNSLCQLMDHRYDLLKIAGAKNIKEYNAKFVSRKLSLTSGHEYMPYIVVIIDEFGDLIMTAGKEVELPIARIAQLARAVGIHMIIATQRPTTSIITGNIKANFPARMAFRVGAMVDSRTILDRPGANQLVGRGDLLFLNGSEPVRVQCAFVDTPEIERINEHIADQPGPVEPLELPEPVSPDAPGGDAAGAMGDLDPFFEEAARAIVISQQGSTSMIQRRFSIGYNRAGRLMDQLETAGVVGAAQGSKPREVLIKDENTLNNLMLQLKG